MKTKNKYIGKKHFVNCAYWIDYYGYYILPTFIFDKNIPIDPLINVSRLSIYFLKFRFSIDFAKIREKREYSWDNCNMNKYIQWWRKEHNPPITKEKIEDFIHENPYIKEVLNYSSADYYYTKRFIQKNQILTMKKR